LANEVFTFLGAGVRVLFQKLISGTKCDLLGKENLNAILFADLLMCVVDSLVNVLDGVLKVVNVAILVSDDLLPVPLVDIPGAKASNS
jgi:hypothetical protein